MNSAHPYISTIYRLFILKITTGSLFFLALWLRRFEIDVTIKRKRGRHSESKRNANTRKRKQSHFIILCVSVDFYSHFVWLSFECVYEWMKKKMKVMMNTIVKCAAHNDRVKDSTSDRKKERKRVHAYYKCECVCVICFVQISSQKINYLDVFEVFHSFCHVNFCFNKILSCAHFTILCWCIRFIWFVFMLLLIVVKLMPSTWLMLQRFTYNTNCPFCSLFTSRNHSVSFSRAKQYATSFEDT